MLARLFDAVFKPKFDQSTNELAPLVKQAAAGQKLPAASAQRVCAECGYDLRGLPGDSRCPECGYPILVAAIQLARMLTEDVEGDPWDHPSRRPFKFVRETLDYPIDAFVFVLDCVRIATAQNKKPADPAPIVSAQLLCDVIRRFAIKHFDTQQEARAVFLEWNIHTSDDIGRIVAAMIRGGVLIAEPGDTIEQFTGLFNVEDWGRGGITGS